MKNLHNVILLFLLIGTMPVISQQIIITDDASYTSPASGSMLDVKSTSKGFMPPRVALTSRTSSPISSPVTGLMIYNTANAGSPPDTIYPGYYYNTGTDVAQNWMRVTNSDVLNGMSFQSDGSPILNGTATVYNDLVVPGVAGFSASTNPPELASFMTTVLCYLFDDKGSLGTEQQIFFSVQMPHDWKEGTAIYPHVHWSPQTTGTGAVVWNFDYTWQNYVASGPVAFPATSSITVTSNSVTSPGDNDKHYISGFPAIDATTPTGSNNTSGKKISSILMCRLSRNSSNTADTYTGKVALLSFDIHYEIDTFGSRYQYIK